MSDPITFQSTTPRLGLPLLFAGQSQKEFIVNESLALLDALTNAFAQGVSDAPPADPAAGDCWLVGSAPTGAFAGREGMLASWDGLSWSYCEASEGTMVRLRQGGVRIRLDGEWIHPRKPALPEGGAVVDEEARGAIATVLAALVELGLFSP